MRVTGPYLLMLFLIAGIASGALDCEDLPCSHTCTLKGSEAACTCPEDMTLGSDKKTCQVPVSFLLAMFRGIKQLTEKTKDNDIRLLIPVATKAFDYNYAKKELFAYSNDSILRYSLASPSDPPKPVLTLDSSATSLAVDWVRADLYWVSGQRSAIEAASCGGGGHRTVITIEDARTQARPGDTPLKNHWHGLVVDPYVEKLFWTDGDVLYRADLAGQDLTTGVGGWRNVKAVCIDTRGQLVYVMGVEDDLLYLERGRYDGSHTLRLANIAGDTVHGMAVLGNTVYWQTSYNGESLYKTEIRDSVGRRTGDVSLVEELNQIVHDFKVYHPDVQKTAK